MTPQHHHAYARTSHLVRKTKQVVMLYDGAIRSVKQARAAIENGDIQARYNALVNACDIIAGLQVSLDFERGGEITKLLYDYYAGLDMRLMSLHQKQDLAMCDLCISHLTMMRDAWEDVDSAAHESGGKAGSQTVLYHPDLGHTLRHAAGAMSLTA